MALSREYLFSYFVILAFSAEKRQKSDLLRLVAKSSSSSPRVAVALVVPPASRHPPIASSLNCLTPHAFFKKIRNMFPSE
jgi:hypothetical protein